MHRSIPMLLAAALLAGCNTMKPEEISSAQTPELLRSAQEQAMTSRWTFLPGTKPQAEIIDELLQRGELTEREAEAIKAGDLFVGMRAEVVKLVLGPPHRVTHLSAVPSDASSFHYSAPGIGSGEVRLRGGKVVSWAIP